MWRNVWELAISIHALLAESDWTAPCSPGGCGYFYPRSPCGERRYASAFPQSMQYFYPRSPCGERRVRQVILAEPFIFISIHALLAESDSRVFMLMPSMRYFYPRSPCGERLTVSTLKILAILFLSTLSLRRATTTSAGRSAFRRHFYPRSPCGERRVGPRWYSGVCNFYPRSPCGERLIPTLSSHAHPGISIHALLAESDPCSERQQVLPRRISIHALLAESDTSSGAAARPSGHFYPRSPCGERLWAAKGRNGQKYFYPRSPCGERLWVLRKVPILSIFLSTLSLRRATRESPWGWCIYQISIHALLAESDVVGSSMRFFACSFLSTLSLRRATGNGGVVVGGTHISIHALLAESDCSLPSAPMLPGISIHALLAESDAAQHQKACGVLDISIHALLAESDGCKPPDCGPGKHFYPRSPCGERPPCGVVYPQRAAISIHALLAESDRCCQRKPNVALYFYPRSPCGERPFAFAKSSIHVIISIHALLAESDG